MQLALKAPQVYKVYKVKPGLKVCKALLVQLVLLVQWVLPVLTVPLV